MREVSGVEHAGRLAKATPLKAIVRTIAIATTPIILVVFFIFFLFHLLTFFYFVPKLFPIGTVASSYFVLHYFSYSRGYKKA
jgi:hypothetical protein